MTLVMTNISAQQEPLSDPAQAGELFDEEIERPNADARYGQSLYYGPVGARGLHQERSFDEDDLRVDIDVEAGRAAVSWLADGSYAVELPPDSPLTVWYSADAAPAVVPAEKARVSIATARRLVQEYVASGKRPSSVEWVTG
ncbi:Imm1 family immunity protein [Actinoplanes sp. NPDC051633]|uniref:Imm1 family immunity protein n=1 Tax=Actinoplanes sp. NPDC051633 TaxID=3155670 RepID=UPI00342DC6BA